MQVGNRFADFLCRELRLVIELDGFSHDLRPERDAARDHWLRGQGYQVLGFANETVLGDPEAVASAIRGEIRRLAKLRLAHP